MKIDFAFGRFFHICTEAIHSAPYLQFFKEQTQITMSALSDYVYYPIFGWFSSNVHLIFEWQLESPPNLQVFSQV